MYGLQSNRKAFLAKHLYSDGVIVENWLLNVVKFPNCLGVSWPAEECSREWSPFVTATFHWWGNSIAPSAPCHTLLPWNSRLGHCLCS